MAIPRPLILDDADLLIGADELTLESLGCTLNHIELNPDVTMVTLTTMCGEVDYPGTIKWTLSATLYQSFDPGATEEVLSAAVDGGVPVFYKIVPRKSEPVSATNPIWKGQLIPQPYSPISGDAGGESTIELEWACTGTPEKAIVDPPVAQGAAA